MKKNILSLIILSLIIAPMFLFTSSVVSADVNKDQVESNVWGAGTGPGGSLADLNTTKTTLQGKTGLNSADPRVIVANVIRAVLGFLGIIAVAIIVIGGFEWMTSGGSDEKAKKGRERITNGVIGLLIILAAYGIANFAIGALTTVTTS